jgi:hypothetical protein
MQGMSFPKPVNLSSQTRQVGTEIRPGSRQMPQLMQMDAKKLFSARSQSFLTAAHELPVAGAAEQHSELTRGCRGKLLDTGIRHPDTLEIRGRENQNETLFDIACAAPRRDRFHVPGGVLRNSERLYIQLPGQGIHEVLWLQGIGGMSCRDGQVNRKRMDHPGLACIPDCRALIDKVMLNTGQTLGMQLRWPPGWIVHNPPPSNI